MNAIVQVFGGWVTPVECSKAEEAFVVALAAAADRHTALGRVQEARDVLATANRETCADARAGRLPIVTSADLEMLNTLTYRVWCVSTPAPADLGPRLRALIERTGG